MLAAAAASLACPPSVRPPPPPLGPPPLPEMEPAADPDPPAVPEAEAEAAGFPEAYVERLQRAAAWLLAGEGPAVRLRFFVPAPSESETPGFERETIAVAQGLRGATTRLVRVDVTVGPYDEAAVQTMRGVGLLPRAGGEPEHVRALLVALDDRLLTATAPAPGRGPIAVQVLLSLHRILRGPVGVGIVVPDAEPAAAAPVAAVLPDFALIPPGVEPSVPVAALVVVATGRNPLPPQTGRRIREVLDRGGGVVLIASGRVVREGRERLESVRAAAEGALLPPGAGLSVEDGLVFDPECARVSVPSAGGRLFLSYPPLVRVLFVLPGGGGRATAVLPFPSPIRIAGDARAEILAASSPESWVETGAVDLDPNRDWRPGPGASRSLAAAVEVAGSGPRPGRLALVAAARFADAEGLAFESNASILAGLVVWAAGVEQLLLVEDEEEVMR
jgi:hypothetical protein